MPSTSNSASTSTDLSSAAKGNFGEKPDTSDKPSMAINGRLITDEEWVKAPEFVPRFAAQKTPEETITSNLSQLNINSDQKMHKKLCPYAERDGICKYPTGECHYLHGEMCDMCARPALHPYNEDMRKKHVQECIQQHERDMELSFAIARSKEKVCGICFEVILQKSSLEQCFGILPNCNHCFCLACIRRWRQAKQFENKIIRACPECRVTSDFVCPSAYWVDTKEEKDKVIDNYKSVLSKKDCKYFKQGRGSCPFGNKCFYMHALNDGTKVDVGPPPSLRSSLCYEMPSEVEIIQRLLMLDYLQDCPFDGLPDELDIDDFVNMVDLSDVFSDSDDSFWSDTDFEHTYLSDFHE